MQAPVNRSTVGNRLAKNRVSLSAQSRQSITTMAGELLLVIYQHSRTLEVTRRGPRLHFETLLA